MPFTEGHPRQREGQSFADHQEEMARWMGYADAQAMNLDHDRLHSAVAFFLGVPSHALRDAAGAALSDREANLAALEEAAVLPLQRYMAHCGVGVPRIEGVRE